MRSALLAAAAVAAFVVTPSANATLVQTPEEEAYTGGFSYYTSFAQDFANEFRCSSSPQRWWCGRYR